MNQNNIQEAAKIYINGLAMEVPPGRANIKYITASVSTWDKRALGFYRHCGFIEYGTERKEHDGREFILSEYRQQELAASYAYASRVRLRRTPIHPPTGVGGFKRHSKEKAAPSKILFSLEASS